MRVHVRVCVCLPHLRFVGFCKPWLIESPALVSHTFFFHKGEGARANNNKDGIIKVTIYLYDLPLGLRTQFLAIQN